MNGLNLNFVTSIRDLISIEDLKFSRDEVILVVKPENLIRTIKFLKYHTSSQYNILSCISCIDYPENSKRFEIAYDLLSVVYNSRMRVKIYVDDLYFLPSLTSVLPCANWWEREVWDLFGIFFKNHPDLRRILTDYGFHGYPMRKDFPLSGYIEVRYNKTQKRIICEPMDQFNKEFRSFRFFNPWKSSNQIYF